ncbi:Ion transport protein-domain-containing protein [Cladochytrium replicatum]|nr:Ion transport protein-domain-containing protein [Cladochytrium replicatum]
MDPGKASVGRAPENAFRDLSSQATVFRTKLIEEFQLLEHIADSSNVQAPTHTSRDLSDSTSRANILLENPYQLIKFQVFKRTQQVDNRPKTDRRLTRTKNLNTLPIGAWAAWVVSHSYFQNAVLFVIVLNCIFIGISAELMDYEKDYWGLFQFMRILDVFSIIIFAIEILLKWVDNFESFWHDGWNISDFAITVISALPELIDLLGTSNTGTFGKVAAELRTLRILRSLKAIVRFGTLRIIILTILQGLKSMAFIMLLIIIVAYIFAVTGVNLFESYTESTLPNLQFQYTFSNIGQSLMTLFQLLTFDQWDTILREINTVCDPGFATIFIISWVFLGGFIFRNVFVGVMVSTFDKISENLKEQKKEYQKLKKFDKMRRKLNKELAVQGNVQKSMTNLKFGDLKKDLNPESVEKESSKDLNEKKNILLNIQDLLVASNGNSKGWESTVAETLTAFSGKQTETMWPRDTLFKYFQVMENLQENMKEYQELQLLAAWTLMELQDES